MDDANDTPGGGATSTKERTHRHGEPGAVRVATPLKKKKLVVPDKYLEHHDTKMESLRSGNIQLRCFLGNRTGPGRSDATTDDWG